MDEEVVPAVREDGKVVPDGDPFGGASGANVDQHGVEFSWLWVCGLV
ncbi:hypothetical protein [Magnetococcus sp. PR-3]